MTSKTIELAQQLVAIPSYVSATQNEAEVIDFLATYAAKKLPQLRVQKSALPDGRENLYLLGKKSPRLVFVGHVDTVQPSDGWLTDPLQPTVKDGKLYGLGVADMKGSIAALLVALQQVDQVLLDEIAVLLYIDEEYEFAGMEQLLKDKVITKTNQPKLVISLDGGLQVLSGCRGVMKIDMEVVGKSGHASNPANGVNAITKLMDCMQLLNAKLPEYASDLGESTMNVAYLRGGAVQNTNQPVDMQRAGNVIPNYAECILELRPAAPRLNGVEAERLLRTAFSECGLAVKSLNVVLDLAAWPGSYDSDMTSLVQQCYKQAGAKYQSANPQYVGFIDVQMLAATIDSPTYVVGVGGDNRHGANECARLGDFATVQAIYEQIVKELLGA